MLQKLLKRPMERQPKEMLQNQPPSRSHVDQRTMLLEFGTLEELVLRYIQMGGCVVEFECLGRHRRTALSCSLSQFDA